MTLRTVPFKSDLRLMVQLEHHPDVIEAGYEQMKTLNTNSRFLHDNLVMLAEKITSTMPEGLEA
jgi:4-aminobutyrate aminotransferase-like enzyme